MTTFSEEYRLALEAAFQDVALHQLLGIRAIGVAPELSIFEMPVRQEAFNPSGNLHGGAIATLIDVSAGTAAALNSPFEPGVNTIVTADMHIRYLGRARGEYVRAESRALRSGRQLVVAECQVFDEERRLIAVADFASMIVPLREPLRPGFGSANNPDY